MARLEQNIITFFWVKKKKEPSMHESLIEVVATSTKPNQTKNRRLVTDEALELKK